MIFTRPSLLISVLFCVAVAALDAGVVKADEYVEGTKVRKVVKLTQENFRTALADPANPVWFLKFYAYWCGEKHFVIRVGIEKSSCFSSPDILITVIVGVFGSALVSYSHYFLF
jgi:hypothetical protein